MRNKAMQRAIEAGAALNLADFQKNEDGDYILSPALNRHDIDGQDLCDSETESWIWSVGLFKDGTLIASSRPYPNCKFYPSTDAYKCVWLR